MRPYVVLFGHYETEEVEGTVGRMYRRHQSMSRDLIGGKPLSLNVDEPIQFVSTTGRVRAEGVPVYYHHTTPIDPEELPEVDGILQRKDILDYFEELSNEHHFTLRQDILDEHGDPTGNSWFYHITVHPNENITGYKEKKLANEQPEFCRTDLHYPNPPGIGIAIGAPPLKAIA